MNFDSMCTIALSAIVLYFMFDKVKVLLGYIPTQLVAGLWHSEWMH